MFFEKPGRENTDQTLELAFERGMALNIFKGYNIRIREVICKPREF